MAQNYFSKNNIFNLSTSFSLQHFHYRVKTKYNMKNYNPQEDHILQFGCYSDSELIRLKNHNGTKYMMWGGTDADITVERNKQRISAILAIPNLIHLAISKNIEDRLIKLGVKPILIDFNLVEEKLFKPLTQDEKNKADSIFIYNGFTKGKEWIYQDDIYKEVIKRLPNQKFIFSNELNLPHHKMPEIYKKCFIGLRLTYNDGNANTVQEFEAMGIPIIHNQSDYGLKWENINDILDYITLNNTKIKKPIIGSI